MRGSPTPFKDEQCQLFHQFLLLLLLVTASYHIAHQLQITDRIESEPSVNSLLNVLMLSLLSTAPAEYNKGK
jgi:succinate dehydrogenase hydrophobic anchor subunit